MLRRALTSCLSLSQRKLANCRHYSAAYDGDSKTTVSFLQQDHPEILTVRSFTDYGFRLSNGSFVVGPMIMFPRTVLHWNIGKPEDINTDSLIIFSKLVPKPDVVILGYGHRGRMKLSPELRKFFVELKIGLEFISTSDAVTTFNYLNGDGRMVAGAFLPLMNTRLDLEHYAKLEEKKRKLLVE